MAVYLLHFDTKIADHAQHYLGYARNVRQRMAMHALGYGHGRLVQVARERAILYAVAREWPEGDRLLERRLKARKSSKQLCPICSGAAAYRRGNYAR